MIRKAIFKFKDDQVYLLCSKCWKILETKNVIEDYPEDLESQYCNHCKKSYYHNKLFQIKIDYGNKICR